jgi:hypothetical protein
MKGYFKGKRKKEQFFFCFCRKKQERMAKYFNPLLYPDQKKMKM